MRTILLTLLLTGCGDAFSSGDRERAAYTGIGGSVFDSATPDTSDVHTEVSSGGYAGVDGETMVDGGLSGMGGLSGAGPTDAGVQCPTAECVANCQYLGMVALCDDASCQCA